MNKREVISQIASKVDLAMSLIRDAESIADENDVSFNFSLGYGVGGTYYPRSWSSSDCVIGGMESGWVSSTGQC